MTFVAVYRGTASQLKKQIDAQIAGDADEFSHALSASAPRSPSALREAAAGYIRGQPFRASSTALFVSIPGAGAVTNQPELLAPDAPGPGRDGESTDTRERALHACPEASMGYSTLARARRRGPAAAAPDVPVRTGDGVVRASIWVGTPLAPVSRAQESVARAFILAGALAVVAALLAALLIGTRISTPLRRMASVAARVDAGDLRPRMRGGDRGAREVQVLAEPFNNMLDRLDVAFARPARVHRRCVA